MVNVSILSWTVWRWKLEVDTLARGMEDLINLEFAVDTIIYNGGLREHVSMQKKISGFFIQLKQFFYTRCSVLLTEPFHWTVLTIYIKCLVRFLFILSRLHHITQNGRVRVSKSRFQSVVPSVKCLLIDCPQWQAPLRLSQCYCRISVWLNKLKDCLFLCGPWRRLGLRSHSAIRSEHWH